MKCMSDRKGNNLLDLRSEMSHKAMMPPIEFISEQRATAVRSRSFITSSRGTEGREFFQEQ